VRVGSLFSGIGGLELGLERAGMTVAWQVERDKFCQRVLARHWPKVARHDDVTTFHPSDFPSVDLICGGFPCQPHSVAGLKKGADDERDLWGEFARIVGEARPRWVVAENVPGLLSTPLSGLRGGFFGRVLADLAGLGYCVRWDVLSASGVGAPHRRRRVFIVAHSHGAGRLRVDLARWQAANAQSSCARPDASGLGLLRGEGATGAPGRHGLEPASTGLGNPHSLGQLESGGCLANFWRWPQHPGGGLAEPGMGGGADGLPPWLDVASARAWQSGAWEEGIPRTEAKSPGRTLRLKALGNAVVPQVAYAVGVAVMAAERGAP
jgi:DNA (cytosine-5)-methyltransferase 1